MDQAISWYIKAADQGYGKAEYRLGQIYLKDSSASENADKGFELLADALEGGHEGAIDWFIKSAEQGNEKAQYTLGRSYSRGLGVNVDTKKALRWNIEAANQENSRAFKYIIDAEAKGDEGAFEWLLDATIKGSRKAFNWLSASADKGNEVAQLNLGIMYQEGATSIVDQDRVLAHMWLNVASVRGVEEAAVRRDFVAKKMPLSQVYEAQQLASEWFARHQ